MNPITNHNDPVEHTQRHDGHLMDTMGSSSNAFNDGKPGNLDDDSMWNGRTVDTGLPRCTILGALTVEDEGKGGA